MLVIGIVGGIASGKSVVAEQFQSLGAEVIDADRLGHQVLSDGEVIEAAVKRWGSSVQDEDGQLNRKAIAQFVFPSEQHDTRAELEFWQDCTHPRITRLVTDRLAELAGSASPPTAVVLDAALLFEAGWDQICDSVIFLEVPRKIRLQRALARGWTEADFDNREAAQMSVDEKRQKADFVIDNSVALDETYRRVKEIWIHLSA